MSSEERSYSCWTEDCCIISIKTVDDYTDYSTLSRTGYASLINSAKNRNDEVFLTFLVDKESFDRPIRNCKTCYKQYTDRRKELQATDVESVVGSFPTAKKLRSSLSHFNWRECCFFCGEEIKIAKKTPQS